MKIEKVKPQKLNIKTSMDCKSKGFAIKSGNNLKGKSSSGGSSLIIEDGSNISISGKSIVIG